MTVRGVSFAELAAMVEARLDSSTPATAAHRRRLLDLINELGAARSGATSGRLLGTEGWQLARISVAGFGGIGAPLVLELPTGPGVTAVLGQNGSGKTSLAAALGFALGTDRAPTTGGPRNGLWRADRVSDGAAAGVVEVLLVRETDVLTINARCPRDGEPLIEARLRGESVHLGRAWIDAVTAANASFTYAGLQARLQRDADLQTYLEELLLLGPAWQLVRAELDDRAAAAKAARKSLNDLRADAKTAERRLYERFRADPRRPVPPAWIRWPTRWSGDVDAWLERNGLAGAGRVVRARVGADHEERAAELTGRLAAAWGHLDAAQDELSRPELLAVLDQIEHLVEHPGLPDGQCPVCNRPTAWRPTARAALGRIKDRNVRVEAVRAAASELSDWVEGEVVPLLSCGIDGGPHEQVEAFRAEVRRDGLRPRTALRVAVDGLGAALAAPSYAEWLDRLRAASDAGAEWAEARRAAVSPLVAAWRERGAIASAADGWNTAAETLAELHREERQRRQDQLTVRLQDAVDRLLPDAGVKIEMIRHRGGPKVKLGVELGLTIGGRPATLGMLSSGQRNALLLASLLCMGPPAPFGFVVIDDPVHALDDLRVDRFAREMVRLAADRQVIVLTHDARLEEQLRAHSPELHLRVLHRDPESARVRVEVAESPWNQLLDQANDVLSTASRRNWQARASMASVVGGLCRNALDGAIRNAVVGRAVRTGTAISDALTELDRAGRSTRRRTEHVLGLAGGATALPATARCLAAHLERWNVGTHGGGDEAADLKSEIRAARDACTELTAWRG